MSISRFYEPFFSFSDVDSLLEDAFKGTRSSIFGRPTESSDQVARAIKPRMDLYENPENDKVTAVFELPGIDKKNVNIDVNNDRLTISGEVASASEKSQGGYFIKERSSGKFSRTIGLPPHTQAEAINASMENGVLTVTFPKISPGQESKRVTIS